MTLHWRGKGSPLEGFGPRQGPCGRPNTGTTLRFRRQPRELLYSVPAALCNKIARAATGACGAAEHSEFGRSGLVGADEPEQSFFPCFLHVFGRSRLWSKTTKKDSGLFLSFCWALPPVVKNIKKGSGPFFLVLWRSHSTPKSPSGPTLSHRSKVLLPQTTRGSEFELGTLWIAFARDSCLPTFLHPFVQVISAVIQEMRPSHFREMQREMRKQPNIFELREFPFRTYPELAKLATKFAAPLWP